MRFIDRLKRQLTSSQALSAYLMLLIILVINAFIQGERFYNLASINSLFLVNTPLILATMAQSVIIFSGGIDLSIGATISLVNAFIIVYGSSLTWPIACLLGILLAVFAGFLKGAITAIFRVPAILVTFAFTYVFEGIALLILPKPGGSMPTSYYNIYGGVFLRVIPVSSLVIAIVLFLFSVLNRRPLGAYIKAAGAQPRSLYIAGASVSGTIVKTYLIAGAITGLAGVCLTILASSGDPRIGSALSLNSIAAAILGGVSLSGGWGSVGGATAGALFLGIINNMIFFLFNNLITTSTLFGIKLSYLQQLLTNIIIILGLSSSLLTRLRKRSVDKESA